MRRHSSSLAALAGALLLTVACGKGEDAQPAAAPATSAAPSAEATPAVATGYTGPRVTNTTIDVYKSPTCGCCKLWIDQLEGAGFTVITHDTQDVEAVKHEMHVPNAVSSCHTAVVNGYVIEGHVPIEMVAKLVIDKPAGIAGIGVNGMPLGAAGMEGYGRRDPFDVTAWNAAGATRIFASVKGS